MYAGLSVGGGIIGLRKYFPFTILIDVRLRHALQLQYIQPSAKSAFESVATINGLW